MSHKQENSDQEAALRDLPVQTENIAYKAEEMILCTKCRRNNPPNRLHCFYCGTGLELSADRIDLIKANLRKLENWEKGFNLIFLGQNSEPLMISEISQIIGLEKEILRNIVEAGKPLPLVRGESEKEIEVIGRKLHRFGLETSIVSDDALAVDKMPVRLRAIQFDADALVLILFNSDEIVRIAPDDLDLIVTGAIFERKTESFEKRKKGQNKVLDMTETTSDDVLIDLYARGGDARGYRVMTKGFDFSCIGAEKGMIAAENLKKLAKKLNQFAPDAKFVDDYISVRENLGAIWEIDERTYAQGFKRQGFGKMDLSNIASSSNLRQLTKYSRLQRQIL